MALPITFQAPGHLIPGPKNLIPEKGDKKPRNFIYVKFWGKIHQLYVKLATLGAPELNFLKFFLGGP